MTPVEKQSNFGTGGAGGVLARLEGQIDKLEINQKTSTQVLTGMPPELLTRIFREASYMKVISKALLPFSMEQLYDTVVILSYDRFAAFTQTVTRGKLRLGLLVHQLSLTPYDWINWVLDDAKVASPRDFSYFCKALPSLLELRLLELQFVNNKVTEAFNIYKYERLKTLPNLSEINIFTSASDEFWTDGIMNFPMPSGPNENIKIMRIQVASPIAIKILPDFLKHFTGLEGLGLLFPIDLPLHPAKVLAGVSTKLKRLSLMEHPDMAGERPPIINDPLEEPTTLRFANLTRLFFSTGVCCKSTFMYLKNMPLTEIGIHDMLQVDMCTIIGLLEGPFKVETLKVLQLEFDSATIKKLETNPQFEVNWPSYFFLFQSFAFLNAALKSKAEVTGSFMDGLGREMEKGRSKEEWLLIEEDMVGEEIEGAEIEEEPEDMDQPDEKVRILKWALGRLIRRFDAELDSLQ